MADRKRQVGKVTGVTTAGGGLGAALAQILVHVWPYLEPVEPAVTVVLTVILALVFGWAVPPQDDKTTDENEAYDDGFDELPHQQPNKLH